MSVDPMAASQCFVDSNVWLYAVIENAKSPEKTATARMLVAERRIISTQVVNEVCVNLLRKAGRSEDEIRQAVQAFYAQCRLMSGQCSPHLNCAKRIVFHIGIA